MKDFLSKILNYAWGKHLLFWVALFLSFTILGIADRESIWLVVLEEMINVLAYASIVYFNFHILIPRFLSRKKVFLFIGSLLLYLVLLTPITTAILHWLYVIFDAQELLARLDQRIIFATFFLVAFISTLFQILSEWMRGERDKRELEQQKTQSELRFLKSQINPHFLFNTLNSLYALTLKKSDQAPETVLKLSDMMRYMLYECNEKTVPLQKEIKYIENYLSLEKIRQGGKIDISFEVTGDIRDQRVAPLLFIPFIENSFKHGVNRQIDNAFVHLNMSVDQEEIIMFLENSKPDIPPDMIKKEPGGIGQKNVRQQLDLLYPGKYELEMEELPLKYTVRLKMQLK